MQHWIPRFPLDFGGSSSSCGGTLLLNEDPTPALPWHGNFRAGGRHTLSFRNFSPVETLSRAANAPAGGFPRDNHSAWPSPGNSTRPSGQRILSYQQSCLIPAVHFWSVTGRSLWVAIVTGVYGIFKRGPHHRLCTCGWGSMVPQYG